MAYEDISDLGCEKTFTLGGIRTDKKTQKRYNNPISVEGYFLGTKTIQQAGQEKPSYLHVFEGTVKNSKGETIFTGKAGIWGKTDMNRKLGGAVAGVMTLVAFTGMQAASEVKLGRKPMYLYRAAQDKANTTNVADIEAGEEAFGEIVETEYSDEIQEEEAPLGEEEAPLDEPVATSAKKPTAAVAPSADRQAKVQGLLAKKSA